LAPLRRQGKNAPETPALTRQEFETFREFFYRHTGMYFQENKRYFVDKRVIARIHENRLGTVREYLEILRHQPAGREMQALINSLTINETYFFRDLGQIECLTRHIIPEVIAQRPGCKSLKIWSSPCASGEEPYSIALYLLEYWDQVDNYEIELYGTDIDSQIIEQARCGIFSPRSVQYLPAGILGRYFKRTADQGYQICNELRDSITFQQVNIINLLQTRGFRDFDIIFSRNMLIYFDDRSRRIACDVFFDALRPGGFVCLAPTESMGQVSSLFTPRMFPGVTVYQKPGFRKPGFQKTGFQKP
jgi:chemotaxis protein methyltransferase CheR